MVPDLKTLVRLFVEMGTLDEAHGAAAALVLIGPADADERALYQQYRPTGVVRAHARLTEEVWQKQIYHPEQDRALSQILATLVARGGHGARAAVQGYRAQEEAAAGPGVRSVDALQGARLRRGGAGPDSAGGLPRARSARARSTSSTCGGRWPAGLPALVLGKGVAEMRSDIELAFVAGRTLAAMRPDHLLRWPSFVPTLAELEIVVHAAIRLVNPRARFPPEQAAAVAQYTTFLERTLPPQLVEQLTLLVRRFQAQPATPRRRRAGRAPPASPRSAPGSCWRAISRWRRASDRRPIRRSMRARSCAISAPGASPTGISSCARSSVCAPSISVCAAETPFFRVPNARKSRPNAGVCASYIHFRCTKPDVYRGLIGCSPHPNTTMRGAHHARRSSNR